MCDYSLHGVKNRLANEGERLCVHKFRTGSKGLASPADLETLQQITPAPQWAGLFSRLRHWAKEKRRVASADELAASLPAVCIPPGARLYLEGIPEMMQMAFEIGEAEEVTFTQMTAEPFRYRDAFRFKNGTEILVQRFPEGTPVEVLALALAEEPEEETKEEPEAIVRLLTQPVWTARLLEEEPAPVSTNQVERGMSANA